MKIIALGDTREVRVDTLVEWMKRVDILLPIVRKGKADKTILTKEIKKLFNKGVIKETKVGVEEERFSNNSLKPKPNTSFRKILNLKQLNGNN